MTESHLTGVVGTIRAFATPILPSGWLPCDGSTPLIDDYPALYAAIGARFGGDGVATFALPNLTGDHHLGICANGYFPLRGAPPADWRPARAEREYVQQQVSAFRASYAQGVDPFGSHRHVAELDPGWLERQARVLQDAYARHDRPLEPHVHVADLDPDWLERQAQVVKDAHARHSHPLEPHVHVSDLDPDWLERQAQVLRDAYAQEHDPHHRHPHQDQLDPDWLAARVHRLKTAIAAGEDPFTTPAAGADDLQRIEGIGPKIAAVLAEAGLATFAGLAAADAPQLRRILRAAQLPMADPETWPEQAALAAAGRWDDLAAWQQDLQGGRRP